MFGMLTPVFTWLDAVLFLVVVAVYVTLFAVEPDLCSKEAPTTRPISAKPMRKDESHPFDTQPDATG